MAVLLLCGTLTFLGAVVLAGMVFTMFSARAAEDWPSTEGSIIRSGTRTEVYRDDEPPNRVRRNTYPDIAYRYHVNEQEYQSDVIRISTWVIEGKQESEAYAAKYPLDATVEVFYDPASPTRSALERGPASLNPSNVIVGGLLVGLGLLGFKSRQRLYAQTDFSSRT
ncbi:MAG: DUF3592 domain-containing protein [Phycisphaeraceae bacterium]